MAQTKEHVNMKWLKRKNMRPWNVSNERTCDREMSQTKEHANVKCLKRKNMEIRNLPSNDDTCNIDEHECGPWMNAMTHRVKLAPNKLLMNLYMCISIY